MATDIASNILSQKTEQPDFMGNAMAGVKNAVGLASMSNQMEQQKLELEKQREQLTTAKFNKTMDFMDKISKSSPQGRKNIAKVMKNQLQQFDIPMSEATLSELSSDPDVPNAFMALKNSGALDGMRGDAQAQEMLLSKFVDELGIVGGMKALADHAMNVRTQMMQQKQLDASANRAANTEDRAEKRLQMQEERDKKKEVENLSKRLGENDLPAVVSAFNSIKKELGGSLESPQALKKLKNVTGLESITENLKIPWTQVAPLQGEGISKQDLPLYQSIASLRNAYLKMRSGGAVTDQEADRFLQELGQGGIRSPEQLQQGLIILQNSVGTGVKNIEAGYDPDVVERYQKRGGSVSSKNLVSAPSAPQKDPRIAKAVAAGYSPEEIEKFIGRKISPEELNTGGQ